MGTETATGQEFPVVFFHFHDMKCYVKGMVRELEMIALYYDLNRNVRHYLYNAYLPQLIRAHQEMYRQDNNIDGVASRPAQKRNMKSWVWHVIRHALRSKRQYYKIWLCK